MLNFNFKMFKNTQYLLFGLLFWFMDLPKSYAQADTLQYKIEGRVNSPENIDKPYVILISVDGLRYDYAEKYDAKNLLRLAESGIRAKALIPSYPSNTFPNHYSIVTGMYPSNHGLIDNAFYDPGRDEFYRLGNSEVIRDSSWYGGLPIWGLAEKNNMVSASLFWVGSESNVAGLSPTYFYSYHEQFSFDRKIEIIKEWLQLPEETRPHLITLYYPEVDSRGHQFGPDAPETEAAVKAIDETIGKLVEEIDQLGLPNVNYVLVSDHGMLEVDLDNPIIIPPVVAEDSNFVVMNRGSAVRIHAKDKSLVKPMYKLLKKEKSADYKVYLVSKTPKRWKFRYNKDDRLGDIILVSDAPKVFSYANNTRRGNPGTHGYDPKLVPEMKATFMAWGPQIREGKIIGEFKNIHIYPILADLLSLPIHHKIDGKLKKKIKKR